MATVSLQYVYELPDEEALADLRVNGPKYYDVLDELDDFIDNLIKNPHADATFEAKEAYERVRKELYYLMRKYNLSLEI